MSPPPDRANLPPDPLGLKHPLQPAPPLGQTWLSPKFLTPLGANSLTILDPSTFAPSGSDFPSIDPDFQTSPFFRHSESIDTPTADGTTAIPSPSPTASQPTTVPTLQRQALTAAPLPLPASTNPDRQATVEPTADGAFWWDDQPEPIAESIADTAPTATAPSSVPSTAAPTLPSTSVATPSRQPTVQRHREEDATPATLIPPTPPTIAAPAPTSPDAPAHNSAQIFTPASIQRQPATPTVKNAPPPIADSITPVSAEAEAIAPMRMDTPNAPTLEPTTPPDAAITAASTVQRMPDAAAILNAPIAPSVDSIAGEPSQAPNQSTAIDPAPPLPAPVDATIQRQLDAPTGAHTVDRADSPYVEPPHLQQTALPAQTAAIAPETLPSTSASPLLTAPADTNQFIQTLPESIYTAPSDNLSDSEHADADRQSPSPATVDRPIAPAVIVDSANQVATPPIQRQREEGPLSSPVESPTPHPDRETRQGSAIAPETVSAAVVPSIQADSISDRSDRDMLAPAPQAIAPESTSQTPTVQPVAPPTQAHSDVIAPPENTTVSMLQAYRPPSDTTTTAPPATITPPIAASTPATPTASPSSPTSAATPYGSRSTAQPTAATTASTAVDAIATSEASISANAIAVHPKLDSGSKPSPPSPLASAPSAQSTPSATTTPASKPPAIRSVTSNDSTITRLSDPAIPPADSATPTAVTTPQSTIVSRATLPPSIPTAPATVPSATPSVDSIQRQSQSTAAPTETSPFTPLTIVPPIATTPDPFSATNRIDPPPPPPSNPDPSGLPSIASSNTPVQRRVEPTIDQSAPILEPITTLKPLGNQRPLAQLSDFSLIPERSDTTNHTTTEASSSVQRSLVSESDKSSSTLLPPTGFQGNSNHTHTPPSVGASSLASSFASAIADSDLDRVSPDASRAMDGIDSATTTPVTPAIDRHTSPTIASAPSSVRTIQRQWQSVPTAPPLSRPQTEPPAAWSSIEELLAGGNSDTDSGVVQRFLEEEPSSENDRSNGHYSPLPQGDQDAHPTTIAVADATESTANQDQSEQLEALAREIYHLLRQRLEIERERQGPTYSRRSF